MPRSFPLRLQLLTLAAASALAACTPPQPQTQAPAAQPSETAALVHARGEVVAITPEYNAITIRHDPIPEYGMAAMVMEFTVDEASDLESVNVGDQVSFTLKGPIDIASITVARQR